MEKEEVALAETWGKAGIKNEINMGQNEPMSGI